MRLAYKSGYRHLHRHNLKSHPRHREVSPYPIPYTRSSHQPMSLAGNWLKLSRWYLVWCPLG
ncbi:Uncharacterised protein [Vibrio cholerae]|nr:Uncharacterised protein [Vibrio cholerae]